MVDYRCPQCFSGSKVDYFHFFTPQCEYCGTTLEEEETLEPYIVDFKELKIDRDEEEETDELEEPDEAEETDEAGEPADVEGEQ